MGVSTINGVGTGGVSPVNGVSETTAQVAVPVNTVLPVITGDTAGSTCTIDTGTWNNSPTSYVYVWYLDGEVIAGENTNSIDTLEDWADQTLTCKVTAINGGGATSVTSAGVVLQEGGAYTGPLDLVPGAVVAFDQFAPSAAWLAGTNNYALLVRDSDNAELQFQYGISGESDSAEITAWRDAAGATDARASAMNDGSGNAINVLRAGGGGWIWNASLNGGVTGFVSDGGLSLVSSGTADFTSGAVSVIAVARAGIQFKFANVGSDFYIDTILGSSAYQEMFDSVNTAGAYYTGLDDTNFHIWEFRTQFGTRTLRIDGVLQTPDSIADSGGALSDMTGMDATLNFTGVGGPPAAQAIYVYDAYKSDADMTLLRNLFSTRYGIAV